MIKTILRSVFTLLLSLLLLILAAHFILINIPGDPASHFASSSENKSASQEADESIQQAIRKRGLHLPDFYFSIHSEVLPPLYSETYNPDEKRNIKQMAYYFGNTQKVESFIKQLKHCQSQFSDDSSQLLFRQMMTDYCSTQNNSATALHKLINANPEKESLVLLYNLQKEMHQQRKSLRKFIPAFSFHPKNRFDQYLFGDNENAKGVLHGSFGTSWQTRMPVSEMIFSGFKWTFLLSALALMTSLILSIFIGMKAGASAGSVFDKFSSQTLFILYSIPVFWLAILLQMLFSNPHLLNWLPASGVQPAGGFQEGKYFFSRLISIIPYLILPLVCFVIPSMAFMARTIRAATGEIMQQDFIRTARAKGLSEKTILYKHVFRNVLLPSITLFAVAWPALLSGSVIIETIFSIPGMGLLTFQAVQQQDYPVLAGVFITTGAITLTTFSLADILYRVADPRLKT